MNLKAASVKEKNNVQRRSPRNNEALSGFRRMPEMILLYPVTNKRTMKQTPAHPRFK